MSESDHTPPENRGLRAPFKHSSDNRQPDALDILIGQRIREARVLNGMSLQDLADQTGVKFQQIQKYEAGINRVSASRLANIARALDTPVTFFFGRSKDEKLPILTDQEVILVHHFRLLSDRKRQAMSNLLESLVSPTPPKPDGP